MLNLKSRKPGQWLWLLFYFQLLSLCVTVISQILTGQDWLQWVNRVITVLSIICLLGIAPANGGYRLSAIWCGIGLGISLINALILYPWHLQVVLAQSAVSDITGFLVDAASLLAMVFSWLAVFWEYRAHGQLIPSLKKSWLLLFVISLCLTLLGSLVSWISVYLVERYLLDATLINAVSYVTIVIRRLLTVAYLWNLHRTAKVFVSNPDE